MLAISLWTSLLATAVSALPTTNVLEERQDNSTLLPYSLPAGQPLRAAGIATKQATFLYGPAVGAGPYYPTGALGTVDDTLDTTEEVAELTPEETISITEETKGALDAAKYNGLQTLYDYTQLYNGEWQISSSPTGQAPGILTNYTQDLLFSMERLSFSPYAVRRLMPGKDTPAFSVSDVVVLNITGQTLNQLFQSGRLFYADHRNQSTLPHNPGHYAAACDAYFYISPLSGDFLPLAIRTNFGSDLIYTPADDANDWLLAKIIFNVNDFFMNQLDHFARNHFTTEIMYEAAVRTMSDEHPVLAILQRLSFEAFSIRPLALLVLLRTGGVFDQYFAYGGAAGIQFTNQTYFNGYAGAIHANYFKSNLQARGLLNYANGPALKNFPFYEDALPLYSAILDFTTAFVNSYYSSSVAIVADTELQAWVKEAQGPAGAIDFPTISTPTDLATLLAEIGRAVSISHHTQNTNQLITSSGVLPFHPFSLYQQLPTTKGSVSNVASYLPNLNNSLGQIQVTAGFSRPLLAGTHRSMINMFNDQVMLALMNTKTQQANSAFMSTLTARSGVVRNRKFGADGLSQGMPFVWQALDPNVAPWSLTI